MNPVVRFAGLALVLVWPIAIEQIQAQGRPTRLNVWDIHIGEAASEIPDGFVNYACSTDGGPLRSRSRTSPNLRSADPTRGDQLWH